MTKTTPTSLSDISAEIKRSVSKIHCAENDPGSVAYVRDATPKQRAEYDRRAGVVFDPPLFEFDHVMIDIETMSLSPNNALILSIGMIEFDPTKIDRLLTGAQDLILPSLEQQLLLSREVSKGTQKFWREQKSEASNHWTREGGRTNLSAVFRTVEMFCRDKSRVWAKGTQFDLSNLVELNRQLGGDGQDALWHYQAPRDMRTFVKETPATRLVPIGDALDIPGVPHEPVYDCISQAWQVWSHWNMP
jgi:hypothetical protein